MYEYIKGLLIESTPAKAIVEAGGVGYSLWIPFNTYSKLPSVGTTVTFFISHIVREDSQKLFGFLARSERDLFENLIEVSGVGPKTGLSLVGHMEINDLQTAISQGNAQKICKIPGIGKKTAERLIVDMRDKIKKVSSENASPEEREDRHAEDAISALIHLGYNAMQSQKAVKAVLSKTPMEQNLAQLITTALRCI